YYCCELLSLDRDSLRPIYLRVFVSLLCNASSSAAASARSWSFLRQMQGSQHLFSSMSATVEDLISFSLGHLYRCLYNLVRLVEAIKIANMVAGVPLDAFPQLFVSSLVRKMSGLQKLFEILLLKSYEETCSKTEDVMNSLMKPVGSMPSAKTYLFPLVPQKRPNFSGNLKQMPIKAIRDSLTLEIPSINLRKSQSNHPFPYPEYIFEHSDTPLAHEKAENPLILLCFLFLSDLNSITWICNKDQMFTFSSKLPYRLEYRGALNYSVKLSQHYINCSQTCPPFFGPIQPVRTCIWSEPIHFGLCRLWLLLPNLALCVEQKTTSRFFFKRFQAKRKNVDVRGNDVTLVSCLLNFLKKSVLKMVAPRSSYAKALSTKSNPNQGGDHESHSKGGDAAGRGSAVDSKEGDAAGGGSTHALAQPIFLSHGGNNGGTKTPGMDTYIGK
ncbi:hypothetical protein KI387_009940, partial [Taxus chinensis]